MPYVSRDYDPYEPMMEDEAKELARAFHSKIKVRKSFFGFKAENSARKRAKDIGKDGIVVRGAGKYRGAFLACELIHIPYPKARGFSSS